MDSLALPLLLRFPALAPTKYRGGIVTLGNFDGVHKGHQHVINSLKEIGKGLPATVVSFYPHPVKVLRGGSEPRSLSSLREKREKCGELGVDLIYGIHFTKAYSRVSARQFIEEVLVRALATKILVVGEDVAVGHNREGNLDFLKRELPLYGIALHVVPKFTYNGVRPSSRTIRELLREGQVTQAADLLGAPFTVSARVGHGDKRGQTIGFPTANVATGKRLLPKRGVYACIVEVEGKSYSAVANIGVRPTFHGVDERLEVHVIRQQLGSLYGKRMHVSFVARLRDEKKFNSIDELKTQINLDIQQADTELTHVR
jgi:riboflavin kinase/FMN adenylyltransferase